MSNTIDPRTTNTERRIATMNQLFGLPTNSEPQNLGDQRLNDFKNILSEELEELDDILKEADAKKRWVAMADLLADIMVYTYSEGSKWGIPIDRVVNIVIDSQHTKLDENNNPIKDERNKFLKGPDYVPPEGRIEELYEELKTV